MRVLLIEDDGSTAGYIAKGLSQEGHNAHHESDGRAGLFLALSESFDAIILDRMLPQMDGLSVLRALRAGGNNTPVLMLTALADVENRVEGLRAGADDYLVKPFAYSELSARLDGLLRRQSPLVTNRAVSNTLTVLDLELDLHKHEARRANRRITLQPREFRLLEYLMRHAGEVVTRTMMLESVWDYHFDPQTNVIDVHISRLRQKIDPPGEPQLLHTVRGAGYRLGD